MERSVKFAEKLHLEGVFPTNAIIAALITKPLEPGFEKVLLKNKTVFAGKNKLTLDLKAAGIKKGNYILTFYYNGRNSFVWITDE